MSPAAADIFFSLLILFPLHLAIVVGALFVVRRFTLKDDTQSRLQLVGKTALLLIAVDLLALFNVGWFIAVIVWLMGLRRLSGFREIVPTITLSFLLGVVWLACVLLVMFLAGGFSK